jgi:hypothetical protein
MRALHVLVLVIVAVAVACAAGCEECKSLLDCPIGSICTQEGKCIEECPSGEYPIDVVVTAPDQITAVSGEVAVDDGAFAATDAAGNANMVVSSGKHVFQAQRGDFTGTIEVEVCGAGQRVAVPIRPPAGTLGVVKGIYDDIDDVLGGMGFIRNEDFIIIDGVDIESPGGLDQFRYVFINCGHPLDVTRPALAASLFDWVDRGGALYTSDWAIDVVETVFPGHATSDFGGIADNYFAQVLDAPLAEHLGKDDVELDYNLGAWVRVLSIGPEPVEELVRGVDDEVRNMPLLFRFTQGEGRVTYTTFHNEAQTTADMDRILSYLVFSL